MARQLLVGTALQTGLAFTAAMASAQPAPTARPMGGTVVAGSAAISRTAGNTRIDQSSQRAAIDWQSFDVGLQQSVTFAQPSASAVALNRVTGADPSQIAGRIDANGQIVLVNQSGVNFYQGSQVNAAGVMVSAAGISNQNFMAGRMVFDQPAHANARISNAGTITVKEAGLAALVAPQVVNSGTINAQLGHVVLAGAKTATLDLYGDGLLSLDVTNQVTEAPVGADGRKATALVTSTGVVIADGGTVQLTARAADGIVQTLVQAGGKIRAATMGDQTGTIALNGVGGSVVVEGQLSVPGRAPGTRGGNVEVVADGAVTLASTARINASGPAGGGTVAVGTTLARAQGGAGIAATRTAKTVTVQQGARITADAKANGNGGRVAVISDQSKGTTQMDGAISAKGGPQGGDGGFVELSGGRLGITGTSDESAPAGKVGKLLLDPTDLNIVETGGSIDGEFSGNKLPSDAADAVPPPSTITAGKLTALGTTGDVIVQATGSIDVQTNISVANGLSLQAGGDLFVDRGVTVQSLAHTLELDAGFNFKTGVTDLPGMIELGTTGTGAAPQLKAVNLTLRAGTTPIEGTGGIDLNDAVITVTNVASINSASGFINQAAAGSLTAATLTGDVTGSVFLAGTANAIASIGDFTATGFDLTNAVPLSIAGAVTANSVFINNTGPLTLSGSLSGSGFVGLTGSSINVSGPLNAGDLALSATNGGISETPTGSIVTNFLNASAEGIGGDISLTSPSNAINTSGGITTTKGNVLLVDSTDLTLTGPYTGDNLFFKIAVPGGTLTLSDIGDGANPAILTATNRISLVADHIAVEFPESDKADSSVTAPTVELAPFSAGSSTSLLSGSGLVIDPILLSIIQTTGGTLEVGGFTNLPAGATAPQASTSAIDIGGPLDLTGIAGTLRLDAIGPITQSGGQLTVGNLAGSGSSWQLTNAGNAVATLGDVTAISFDFNDSANLTVAGNLAASIAANIIDAGVLTVSGQINSSNVGLTATDIVIPGAVTGSNVIALNATGSISATGILATGELTGIATGAANMTGANRIAQLGPFSAASLVLNDTMDLLLTSELSAAHATINVPANRITIADGAVILTGGSARPLGPLDPVLEPNAGAPGAFLKSASFAQIGSGTVAGQGGGPATLQISVTGNADFDPPLGLLGTNTWLILNLTNGAATGNVFVNALDVTYTVPGGTNLLGTIAGITGGPAAAAGNIQPAINSNYLFNGCIIAAPVCQPSPPSPPPAPPPPTPRPRLSDSQITSALGGIYPFLPGSPPDLVTLPHLVLVAIPLLHSQPPQLTDTDVVPPNITYLDY
jgi:filamentous hemagglutinin family protein